MVRKRGRTPKTGLFMVWEREKCGGTRPHTQRWPSDGVVERVKVGERGRETNGLRYLPY